MPSALRRAHAPSILLLVPTIPQILDAAIRHHEVGQLEQAAALYERILAENPQHADALQLRGVIEHQRGNHRAAIDIISRALQIKPREPAFWCNLAEAQRAAREVTAAENSLRHAIELQPSLAVAHNNLALVLDETGHTAAARASYEQAIRLQPRYFDAHLNLAKHHARLENLDGAAAAAKQALALDPRNVQALAIAGNALAAGGEPSAGIELLGRAMALAPTSATAWHLAGAFRERGDHAESIDMQREAVELDPNNADAHGNVMFNMHYGADIPAQTIAAEHFAWAIENAEPVPRMAARAPSQQPRLRVGYVSGDFRRHAVAQFFRSLLAAHEPDAVEVFCYCNNAPDAVTEELRPLAEDWRDILRVSDDDVAKMIRADEIDVLVDLSGHTKDNRLLVFARKPAPIQATYLGYPDTTGMTAMDFRITDDASDPPGMTEALHSEKLARVSNPFLAWTPPADSPPPSPSPLEQNGYVTFGSFNRPSKISSATIELWAKVLRAAPRSRLVIKGFGLGEPATQDIWRARFSRVGVDPQRIDLFNLTLHTADHLRQLTSIDIALDTFPYNGTATTCESMWMGVPVVTLAGRTHVSRVGVSLLSSVGLAELVATSPDDFVAKAIALAGDPSRLRALRRDLRDMIARSPLADAKRLARDLESLYQQWVQAAR